MRRILALVVLGCRVTAGWGQGAAAPDLKMAAAVMERWPAGVISTEGNPGTWSYEEGVVLDGMAAEWHASANGDYFRYIKASVDKYVTEDGTIQIDAKGGAFPVDAHSLDEIEMGRAVLLVYRVTVQAKYAKAAKFIHDQLASQPRTASGGYWQKNIYPNQMWLDGAYMAGVFRAEYAVTFQEPGDLDDVAKQLLLMDAKMRDPQTGLLRQGWDDSKTMPWADKTTGLSPEVWARAMGWYAMALVDVLDWMPAGHSQRAALVAAFARTMAGVVKYQDPATGAWWQVLDKGPAGWSNVSTPQGHLEVPPAPPNGNYVEASASCMFVYALAKGVRLGYLPQADAAVARRGWDGIQTQFVKTGADGLATLTGTVKAGGLGGTPYRSGTFAYDTGETKIDNDAKGVGTYLMAGAEMQQAATEAMAQGKTVLLDAWFNSQTRKNALGQTEMFHYKWDDDSDNGYGVFGRAFQRYGARLAEQKVAPNAADLAKAQVYILVGPDIPVKNPAPHYMDRVSGDAIEAWVKRGGVLLLFMNDRDNTEFEHLNTLSDRFGIHFNPVLSHHVVEPDHGPGEVTIPPGTGIFGDGFKAYMKDTSTITVSRTAKAVVTDKGDVMIAVAKAGKGQVFAVVDPWFYNEYADGRKMRQYEGREAAEDVAAWALKAAK